MMTTLRTIASLALALGLSIPVTLAQTPTQTEAADDSDIAVRAEKDGENIIIDVEMRVRAPLSVVWDVFTDYDHMTRFVSSVHSSRIIDRSGSTLRVAQKSSTELGLLKFEFDNVRQVELVPHTEIHSRLISGDMKDSAFSTRFMSDSEGETRVYNHGSSYRPCGCRRWSAPRSLNRRRASSSSSCVTKSCVESRPQRPPSRRLSDVRCMRRWSRGRVYCGAQIRRALQLARRKSAGCSCAVTSASY